MACIAPAPDGSVASLVEAGGSAVVVVPAERRPPVADVAWARWTARTQTALHRLDAAIACRWDAVWPDAPSLVKWLEVRSAALGRELDEIRGRVELVLHLPASVGTGQDPESAASGASGASGAPGASWAADARGDFDAPASQWRRRRLRGRARDAAARAGRAIDGPLAAFAATVRRAVPDAVGESAIVRLLVDHAAVEEVRTAAGALREAGLVERLAGPWVPGPITTHVTG